MTALAYTHGAPVSITVTLPLVGGSPVVPTALSRVVLDETGAVIASPLGLALPASGALSLPLTVAAQFNTVPDGVAHVLRQVVTTITTTSGVYQDSQSYIVKSDTPLVRMSNSFITFPETVLTRFEMSNLDGWDQSTDDQRLAALVTAYRSMLQLRYRYPLAINGNQNKLVDFYGTSIDNAFGRIYMVLSIMEYYTATDFDNWPVSFQTALKRAQMAEANVLLRGDPVADKRRQGIESEKIGESAMSFRKVPEVVTPVSREALVELRGYLDSSLRLGRG